MTNRHTAEMSDDKPEQFFECVQVIFTGHDHTEDVSSDVSVHPLFPGQLQDFGTKLKQTKKKITVK